MTRYPYHGDLLAYVALGLYVALFVSSIVAMIPQPYFNHESLTLLASDALPLEERLTWTDEIHQLDLQSRRTLKDFVEQTVLFLAGRSLLSDEMAVVVGTSRLRQIRARNEFVNIYGTPCEWAGEDKEPRTGAGSFTVTKTAWLYAPDAGVPVMEGRLCQIPKSGYYLDLLSPAIANNRSCEGSAQDCYIEYLKAALAELEEGEWIDSLTRTVSFSFTLYDRESDIFCSAQFVWENLAFDSWWMTPAIHSNYRHDVIPYGMTLAIVILVTVMDLVTFVYSRRKRILQALVLDFIILVCVSCIIHGNEGIDAALDAMRERLDRPEEDYEDGAYVGVEHVSAARESEIPFVVIWAIAVSLRYLQLEWHGTRKLTMLMFSLQTAAVKTIPFLLAITLMQFFMASMVYQQLGADSQKFSSFRRSFVALVAIIQEDLDYDSYYEAKGTIGQFLFLYMTIIFFVFLQQQVIATFFDNLDDMTEGEGCEEERKREKKEKEEEEVEEEEEEEEDDLTDAQRLFLNIVKEELEKIREKEMKN